MLAMEIKEFRLSGGDGPVIYWEGWPWRPDPRAMADLIQILTLATRAAEALPEVEEVTEEKIKDAFARSWNVIVWNDPVNLMTYVVFVFMKVLGFPREKATKHMLEVHEQGKSCVATETREKAELYHQQLQGYGLTVSIEQI
jgi:ATP-dependent Clp protease adaptor protein ClpS